MAIFRIGVGDFRARLVLWVAALSMTVAGCSGTEDGAGWKQGLFSQNAVTRAEGGALTGLPGGTTAAIGADAQTARPYLRYGDDTFVNEAYTGLPAGGQRAPDGGILLNFEDAALRDVAKTILGDLLEQNYLFDPRVEGRVTLQTVSPLSEEDTLATFGMILRQNGAALIQRNGVYTVVPQAEAASGAVAPILAGGAAAPRPGYAVMVAPLESASASELAGVLEPLSGPQTEIRVDAARNALILSGAASELAALRETISLFDVDWMDGLSYGLFPLKRARAADVAEELQAVLGGDASPIKDQVVLEPIERMNAVLVVTKRRAVLEKLRNWVGRLDRDGADSRDGIYVYRVENVAATDLAAALLDVFGSGAQSARTEADAEIASDSEDVFANGTETVTEGDVARDTPPRDPEPAAARLQPLNFAQGEDVRIHANETNNTLVIRAEPDTYRRILAILKQLDVAPLQVLIDATIAEVALTDQLNYGVQVYLDGTNTTYSNTPSPFGVVTGQFPGFVASYVTGGSQVVLSALDAVTRLHVISTPRLMVLDNQSARLNVGDEVPIITEQQSSASTGTTFNSVTFRQTGVVLEVTPRVSSSGLVTLDIRQETSNVKEDDSNGTLTPTISQRTIETSIAVQDGQTILLGGLIQRSDASSKSGMPILSDVPGIGGLFGTRRNARDRTEMIILLTPRVMRNPHDVRDATNELRHRLKALPPEFFPQNALTRRSAKRR